MKDLPEAKVDWEKYPVDVSEPKTWVQLISQFRGREVIISIAAIAIAFIWTRSELVLVPLAAIGALLVLGLAELRWRKRKDDATAAPLPSKNKTKPGHAGRNQATA